MLKYLLGVEVMRSKQRILLSQQKYVFDMLSKTKKLGAKPCSTPMTPNVQITKEGDLFEDLERYRRVVGKLNCLTITLPDIAYSISILSHYMSSFTVNHWVAMQHILCYLKEAPGRGILYKKHGHTRIECISDADWARSKEDRRSTSRYCAFFLEEILSHGKVKGKLLSCGLVRSQSIEP